MKYISKKARIKQLESQLDDKDWKIHRLEGQVAYYQYKFEEMQKTSESTPKDCKPGEYCEACSFAKSYHVRNRHGDLETYYFCGKDDACENFVQKGD